MWTWLRRILTSPVHREQLQATREDLAQARQRLADTARKDPAVRSVVSDLRRIQEQNNYAAMVRRALGG